MPAAWHVPPIGPLAAVSSVWIDYVSGSTCKWQFRTGKRMQKTFKSHDVFKKQVEWSRLIWWFMASFWVHVNEVFSSWWNFYLHQSIMHRWMYQKSFKWNFSRWNAWPETRQFAKSFAWIFAERFTTRRLKRVLRGSDCYLIYFFSKLKHYLTFQNFLNKFVGLTFPLR